MSTVRKSLSIGTEAFDFLKFTAESRELSVSATLTLILQVLLKGDYASLRSMVEDFASRRQY